MRVACGCPGALLPGRAHQLPASPPRPPQTLAPPSPALRTIRSASCLRTSATTWARACCASRCASCLGGGSCRPTPTGATFCTTPRQTRSTSSTLARPGGEDSVCVCVCWFCVCVYVCVFSVRVCACVRASSKHPLPRRTKPRTARAHAPPPPVTPTPPQRVYPKGFVDDYLRMVRACAERDSDGVVRYSTRLGFLTGAAARALCSRAAARPAAGVRAPPRGGPVPAALCAARRRRSLPPPCPPARAPALSPARPSHTQFNNQLEPPSARITSRPPPNPRPQATRAP